MNKLSNYMVGIFCQIILELNSRYKKLLPYYLKSARHEINANSINSH